MSKSKTIILCCKKCGNYSISRGKFFGTFFCESCQSNLNMYDVSFVEAEISVPFLFVGNKFVQQSLPV